MLTQQALDYHTIHKFLFLSLTIHRLLLFPPALYSPWLPSTKLLLLVYNEGPSKYTHIYIYDLRMLGVITSPVLRHRAPMFHLPPLHVLF